MLDAPLLEEHTALAIAAYEKGRHKPALPPSIVVVHRNRPTVKEMIVEALKDGPLFVPEIARKIHRRPNHVGGEMSELCRMGLVERRPTGCNSVIWSLPE